MAITHNNVLYDGTMGSRDEIPIKIISDPDQIYPVGTICNVNVTNEDQIESIFLRAEIRIEAESFGPADGSAVMLVSGKTLKG